MVRVQSEVGGGPDQWEWEGMISIEGKISEEEKGQISGRVGYVQQRGEGVTKGRNNLLLLLGKGGSDHGKILISEEELV